MDKNQLHKWFDCNQRIFPWRKNRNPYTVFISEIMLQQTRAEVVVPYFLKFLTLFPNIKALASAPLEAVIKAWEGLGYYSRARNLHATAKIFCENYEGKIPSDELILKRLKGLGPYTVNAILCFAFNRKKAPLDGNVIRLLTRFYKITEDVTKQRVKNRLFGLFESLLDEKNPNKTAEAFIEFGAVICKKTPKCPVCPFKDNCSAYQSNLVNELPFKSKKQTLIALNRAVCLFKWKDQYLVFQEDKKALMKDLYQFPFFDSDSRITLSNIKKKILEKYFYKIDDYEKLPVVQQFFTKYQVQLYPYLFTVREKKIYEGYDWMNKKQMKEKPFSSGHKKILQLL